MKMRNRMMLAAMAAFIAAPAWSQTATVWDGVYTEAQAARGATQYLAHCAICHDASLQGNGEAPPLVGRFIPDWDGTSLADLYEKIAVTMPLNRPGSVSAGDNADILAYLLKANDFPSGSKELGSGDELKAIGFAAVKPAPVKPAKAKPAH